MSLTAFSTEGEVEARSNHDSQGKFCWGENEHIAVYSKGAFSDFSMVSGAGTNKAVFTGEIDDNTVSTFALYPYRDDYSFDENTGVSSIGFVLPDEYNDFVPGQTNSPMYSTIQDIESGEVHFLMLTGILRYEIKNLPAGTASLVFITDKKITGRSSVILTNPKCPYVDTPDGLQYVTYFLKEVCEKETDLTIDVPIPAGSYDAFAVDIKDSEGKIICSLNFLRSLDLVVAHIQMIKFDCLKSQNIVQIPDTGLASAIIVTPEKKDVSSKEDWTDKALFSIHNYDGTIDAFGLTSIKGRGNSTWSYPKKPYSLKLESKAKVLGMPKNKRWCLLANWMDRTLMRNAVAFEIARRCPGLKWTPSGEYVEMIINGQHIGNYYLCEQIKVDKNRVNISELDIDAIEGDLITGGYLMELDVNYDEPFKFHSVIKNYPWMFKDPDEVNLCQFSYMENFVNSMELSLYDNTKFSNREFDHFLDVESFADYFFVYALSGNYEPMHPKSVYMNKDINGKITAGPVWDFDWGTFTPGTEQMASYEFLLEEFPTLYYDRLFSDNTFRDLLKTKWQSQKNDFAKVVSYIDCLADKLCHSEILNHELWPITSKVNGDEELTFEEAIGRMKKSFMSNWTFLDGQISLL